MLGDKQSDTTRFNMSIIWTILIGFVVGTIAKLLMPGKDPGGFIVTILLGIAGSFVASYLGQLVGWYKAGQTAGLYHVGCRRHDLVAAISTDLQA